MREGRACWGAGIGSCGGREAGIRVWAREERRTGCGGVDAGWVQDQSFLRAWVGGIRENH